MALGFEISDFKQGTTEPGGPLVGARGFGQANVEEGTFFAGGFPDCRG
jgi:hypothetical protein